MTATAGNESEPAHWCMTNSKGEQHGFKAACRCGWTSGWYTSTASAVDAGLDHTAAAAAYAEGTR